MKKIQDIGRDSVIQFVFFYLYKALQAIKPPQARDTKKYTKHNHNYTKFDQKSKDTQKPKGIPNKTNNMLKTYLG